MAKIQLIQPKKTAHLIVSDTAWIKMQALVEYFDIEVQWHGIAKRGRKKNEYILKDILLFPHKITSVSGESDQEEYEAWLDALPDKTINNMRFHGHSHVNMSTSPSGFDMEYRKNLLKTIPSSSFYIFAILNKRGEFDCQIYDNGEVYDDINVCIKCRNCYLNDFVLKAKELAVPLKTPPKQPRKMLYNVNDYDDENLSSLLENYYGYKQIT